MALDETVTISHEPATSQPRSPENPLAVNDNKTNSHAPEEKALDEVKGSIAPASSTPSTPENQASTSRLSDTEWKAGRDEWMIIIVIAIVSLMVALDATILVPVLPVSPLVNGTAKQRFP